MCGIARIIYRRDGTAGSPGSDMTRMLPLDAAPGPGTRTVRAYGPEPAT